MDETDYSEEKIEMADLDRLASLAERNRNTFFARRGRWRIYQDRIVAVALCQGAALHFVDRKSGVKDFDVWTFYATHPAGPFPARIVSHEDFGESKFGRNPNDTPNYRGRRIDLIGRAINCDVSADPIQSVRMYLSERRTRSARELARKAVVLIEPKGLRGIVIWPLSQPLSSERTA